MTYFITLDGNKIDHIYSDENKNVPKGAKPITDDEFLLIRKNNRRYCWSDGKLQIDKAASFEIDQKEKLEKARRDAEIQVGAVMTASEQIFKLTECVTLLCSERTKPEEDRLAVVIEELAPILAIAKEGEQITQGIKKAPPPS